MARACSLWNYGRVLHPTDLPIGSSWADRVAAVLQLQSEDRLRLPGNNLLRLPQRTTSPNRATGLVLGEQPWEGAVDFVLAVAAAAEEEGGGNGTSVRGAGSTPRIGSPDAAAARNRRFVSVASRRGGFTTPSHPGAVDGGGGSDSDGTVAQNPEAPRIAGPQEGRSYLAQRRLRSPILSIKRGHDPGALHGGALNAPLTPVSPVGSIGGASAVEHEGSVPRGLAVPLAMQRRRRLHSGADT